MIRQAENVLGELGDVGARVLDRSVSMPRNRRYRYLVEAASLLHEEIEDAKKYRERPVDVRTFVEDPGYMDAEGVLWPRLMDHLVELCSGHYEEAVLTGGIGVGKCLAPGTPVVMWNGTTRAVEDVVPGDKLMGPDGRPRWVENTVTGRQQMYRVRQKGGEDYVVNEDHILSLKYTDTSNVKANGKTLDRYGAKKGDVLNISVLEYLGLSKRHRGLLKGWRPDGVEFSGSSVYEPYLIGLWLGDGTSKTASWTVADSEVADYLRRTAHRYGMTVSVLEDPRGNAAKRYTIRAPRKGQHNPILHALHDTGLIGNKHVPTGYMRAPMADRLKLLAGLLDSDGYLTPTNTFEFVQKNRRLFDAVVFVARSCGFRVSTSTKEVNGEDYFRAHISGEVDRIPTLIERKQAAPRKHVKDPCVWGIEVEPVGEGTYHGFELSGCDRLFLLGDFTVTHNTTLALYAQAYELYKLALLIEPHKEFDLDPASEIVVILQSVTGAAAHGVNYRRFRAMIERAPWFRQNFPFDEQRESDMRFPNKVTIHPISGVETGAIGENVIGGIIDEINFMAYIEKSKRAADGGDFDQAAANYSAIARRRESRFMVRGKLPGLLIASSSARYPGQFTDRKKEEAKTNDRIYVYDEVVWNLRPERFGEERFRVFIGDDARKPRIMDEDEAWDADDPLVIEVPEEYRSRFRENIYDALRDVAGKSTRGSRPFIPDPAIIARTFGRSKSILSHLETDLRAPLEVFLDEIRHPDEPRFAHVDLGLVADAAGISMGHVPGFTHVDRGEEGDLETLPVVDLDFILRVTPPPGGEIDFAKIRTLFTMLRREGVDLRWISYDGWQSRDSIQRLRQRGFRCGEVSMDRTIVPYDVTKAAMGDGRVLAPAHETCEREFRELQLDLKPTRAGQKQGGKIDHPPTPGASKDCSDSVAGVVYGLTTRREIWARHDVPIHLPVNLREAMERMDEKVAA